MSVVPGEIGGVEIPHTVSGRELWERLGIKKHYTQWMEVQLGEMFSQDVDFEAFNLKVISGNKPEKNHRLTLDCAKHIALMSRTEVGKKVRAYFIAVENRARESVNHGSGADALADALLSRLDARIDKRIDEKVSAAIAAMPAVTVAPHEVEIVAPAALSVKKRTLNPANGEKSVTAQIAIDCSNSVAVSVILEDPRRGRRVN